MDPSWIHGKVRDPRCFFFGPWLILTGFRKTSLDHLAAFRNLRCLDLFWGPRNGWLCKGWKMKGTWGNMEVSHVPNIDVNVCMCVIFSKRIYIWYISMWIYIQIYIYIYVIYKHYVCWTYGIRDSSFKLEMSEQAESVVCPLEMVDMYKHD